MMGRRREGNYTTQKINSIEDLVRKEENGYPDTDSNKTMINITIEPCDAYKNLSKN
jgi:hypothetical protein